MELTRRDALLALAGGGLIASGAAVDGTAGRGDATVSDADRETLVAAAEVLYPSSVTVTDEFVRTYVLGRQTVDETYLTAIGDALDEVLRATGADRAYADPEGTVAQRIRYYVVDELLYAFYATPKGAGLMGSENPDGYPGGTARHGLPSGVSIPRRP